MPLTHTRPRIYIKQETASEQGNLNPSPSAYELRTKYVRVQIMYATHLIARTCTESVSQTRCHSVTIVAHMRGARGEGRGEKGEGRGPGEREEDQGRGKRGGRDE